MSDDHAHTGPDAGSDTGVDAGTGTDPAAVFEDPAAVLRTGRARLRELLASCPPGPGTGGPGREVVSQTEAVLGTEPVPRSAYASWLHFAATTLGHTAYAEGIAAAAPHLPWRTLWAWCRPVGAYRANPNLSGGGDATVFERTADGNRFVRIQAMWCPETWIDLGTGARSTTAPEDVTEVDEDLWPDGPWLFEPEDGSAPYAPAEWEAPLEVAPGRYLLVVARGLFLLEENRDRHPAPAPAGGEDGPAEPEPAEEPGDGPVPAPWFADGGDGGGALTAERLDEVFGTDTMVRVPAAGLPETLRHPATRDLLSGPGLPEWWGAGTVTFRAESAGPRPDSADGLLRLGGFDFGYCDEGDVLVDGTTGAVLLRQPDATFGSGGEEPFPLCRDTEVLVRFLEGVRRHMGSCWDGHEAEGGISGFRRSMRALDPEAIDGDPSGEVWGHVFAGITELGIDGF
ncbi:SUKH-4 family immunity protein [Streptomyces sp. NPDC089799]|uniref:SUKH-4 family immunity protein n=1 Tax=Streptomyces sp. NPDC089799 TaxID=3155066 RepID=UPI00342EA972